MVSSLGENVLNLAAGSTIDRRGWVNDLIGCKPAKRETKVI
jgi:hypothetical protein